MAKLPTDRMDNLTRNINRLNAGLGACTAIVFWAIAMFGVQKGLVPLVVMLPPALALFAAVAYLLRSGRASSSIT